MPINNPLGYSKGAVMAFWQSQRQTDHARMGIMVLGIAPPFKSWGKSLFLLNSIRLVVKDLLVRANDLTLCILAPGSRACWGTKQVGVSMASSQLLQRNGM